MTKPSLENQEALSHDELVRLLDYSPLTGEFRWKIRPSNSVTVGSVAGTIKPDGYCRIKVGGRLYLAHRLTWYYVYGTWPKGVIDHINGTPSDNRITNLRLVSNQENNHHRNDGGGYSWNKRLGKWQSYISIDDKARHLGYFDSPAAARLAYVGAKSVLHPAWIPDNPQDQEIALIVRTLGLKNILVPENGNTHKGRGYSFNKAESKYQAYVHTPTGRNHLGYFQTAKEARAVVRKARANLPKQYRTISRDGVETVELT